MNKTTFSEVELVMLDAYRQGSYIYVAGEKYKILSYDIVNDCYIVGKVQN